MFIYGNNNVSVCLLAVIFLQQLLALVSHLHPPKTADTALADIHQCPSMTRRSENRCQCLSFKDLPPSPPVLLASGLALLPDTPRPGAGNRCSPPFIAQVSRTLMNQCDLPLTLSWEMNWRGVDEGGSTFVLPARAFVCLSQRLSIPGKNDAVIFIWLQIEWRADSATECTRAKLCTGDGMRRQRLNTTISLDPAISFFAWASKKKMFMTSL